MCVGETLKYDFGSEVASRACQPGTERRMGRKDLRLGRDHSGRLCEGTGSDQVHLGTYVVRASTRRERVVGAQWVLERFESAGDVGPE